MRRVSRTWVKAASGAAALIVVAGGGYTAYAATAASSAGYRSAAVTTGDVEQTLSLTGTVAPNGRADLAFATDGTVETVVAEGDTVKKGQVVARLDRTSLKKSLTSAKATLAAARAQLQSDKEAQVSGVTSTSSTTSSGTAASPSSTGSSGGNVAAVWTGATPSSAVRSVSADATADLVAKVKEMQHAVVSAQKALDTADTELGTAQMDLASALEKLTALVASGGTLDEDGELAGALKAAQASCADDTSTSCDEDLETALGAQDSAGGAVTEAAALLGSAQSAVADAKAAVSTAKADLLDYSERLDETLAGAGSSGGQGQHQSGGQTQEGSGQPSGGSDEMPNTSGSPGEQRSGGGESGSGVSGGTSGSGGSGGSAGESVTAATLAKDQAEIDRAKAEVAEAKAALAGAVLKAPAAGTVASVAVKKGDGASAGTEAVTLIAEGLTSVELTVSAAQVEQLEAGQVANVTPAGAEKALPGKVTLAGQVPDTSSGSSTFPVTVTLDETGLDLLAGNMASVEVVVGSVDDVVTIPASALSNGSVLVIDGDTTQRKQVTTGLFGTTRIEVTDGLENGQQVVLADLSQDLPSGDTSEQQGFGRTGGSDVQVPGGSGPGGQMPGISGGGQR